MDPNMQQFLAAQMQLIQNLTNTVQQMQAQQNQPPQPIPPPPPPPRDRHKEFMSHHPPTSSHSSNPLDADDWLRTITKKLEIMQCTDREMVLYAAGRLVGQAADCGMRTQLLIPTGRTSLGRSPVTTSVLTISLQG
jgi:hypothetical protein